MQRCLSIATVVANGCGSVANLRTGKRFGSLPHEHPSKTSHHKADVDPCIVEC
jgi:hypothetical protein